MTTLRGIAQLSDCLLTHMLLAYWRKLLACSMITFPRARARFFGRERFYLSCIGATLGDAPPQAIRPKLTRRTLQNLTFQMSGKLTKLAPKKRATSLLGYEEHVPFRLNDHQRGAGGVALLGCCINAERKKGERSIVEKEV